MLKYLFILGFMAVGAPSQTYYEYKNFITSYEGVIHYPAKDHIGIGHHQVGLENRFYDDSEINDIFAHDLNVAISDAHRIFPSFESQPPNVKLVLISLSFNLGLNRLSKFIKFREAIESKNYHKAANELQRSKWFLQVKRRGPAHCATLEAAMQD